MFSNHVAKTFNWLNGDKAKIVAAICRKHGGQVKRLAQERNALGYCKIVATFSKGSWAASSEACGAAKQEIADAGLINSLTFQN